METVKDNNHEYEYATLCKSCNGTGEFVRRGYDYGHGWSCEEVRRPCNMCNGTGRLLVKVQKHAVVSALTKEEWDEAEAANPSLKITRG